MDDPDARPRGIFALWRLCCCISRKRSESDNTLDIYVTSDRQRLLGDKEVDYGAEGGGEDFSSDAVTHNPVVVADFSSDLVSGVDAAAKECEGVSVLARAKLLRGDEAAAAGDAPSAAAPPLARECAGVSVAARSKELAREAAPAAAAPPRRTSAAAAAAASRLATAKSRVDCALCGLGVLASEAVSHRTWRYHAACFRCGFCGRSLVGIQHSRLDDDDLLL